MQKHDLSPIFLIKKKRSRPQVVEEILRVIASNGGLRLTHVMQQVNINHSVAIEVLNKLHDKGVVNRVKLSNGVAYLPTDATDEAIVLVARANQLMEVKG